jgi:hypothetical protein
VTPPIWLAATVVSALVVVALAPLGRTLTARVGATLLVWLAWSQFAYLPPWPPAFPPRQAVAWILAAVAVLAWRVARRAATGLRRSLPRLDAAAAALAVFGLVVAWWFLPWRGDADHVLTRMMLGWDHSGHFGMVEQLRTPQAAAVSSFAGYPRGYHALVASLMELGSGAPAGLDSELVAYAYAALAVMAASLVLLAAFVLRAPVFRRRGVLAVPAVALLVTLYLQLDDASQVPYYGFGNFLEAAAFAGAACLLPLDWGRRADAWRWFLFGSAAAGIVGTWPLLLAFLVPVPVAVWLARRTEPGVIRRLALTAPAGVLPVVFAFLAQPPAAQAAVAGAGLSPTLLEAIDHFLLLDGAILTDSLSWPIMFALSGLAAPLALLLVGRRRPPDVSARRAAALWPVPLASLAMALGMVGYEHLRLGIPRYYGMKVLCATTLSAGAVGLVAGAELLAVALAPLTRRAWAGIAAVLAAVLLLCAGAPAAVGPLPASPGGAVRALLASGIPDNRQSLAEAIRASCTAIAGQPGEYYLLVAGANHGDLVRANVWLITCGLDWGSADHSPVLRQLLPDQTQTLARTVTDPPTDARAILAARPQARVVVSSTLAPLVRMGLPGDDQQRVVTY